MKLGSIPLGLAGLTAAALLAGACSLAPERPVTRRELMRTGIYQTFILQESPEQILDALNSRGEVILDGRRNIPGKNYPVDVKILATSEGLDVHEYDK